jgi:hypothetical protein
MQNAPTARRNGALKKLIAAVIMASLLSPRAASAGAPSSLATADDVVVIPENTLNAVVWYALATRGTSAQPASVARISSAEQAADDDYDDRLRRLERIFADTVFARMIKLTHSTLGGSGSSILTLLHAYEARIGLNDFGVITNRNVNTLGDCIGAFFEVATQDPAYRDAARQIYYELRQHPHFAIVMAT